MQMNYIYAILDPLTNEHRYIGRTVDLRQRWKVYKNAASHNTAVNYWVKGLQRRGLTPKFIVIDLCAGVHQAQKLEKFYIETCEDGLLNKVSYQNFE